jgi:hypothetical protein
MIELEEMNNNLKKIYIIKWRVLPLSLIGEIIQLT